MIGETISHYRVLRKLGGGGMGVVYEAEDIRLGRHVALKFLPDELSNDAESLERFRREARAASALNHANICTIHDIDEHDGREFIVMELLEGATLKHRLTTAPFNPEYTIDCAIQIASAISAAHAKGIVHRDIKPANVFVTDSGQVKVLDFGLAKVSAKTKSLEPAGTTAGNAVTIAEEHLTSPGKAVGTIAYMSPEQARGEELDARTDLFSLGAVLYEMASGRLAFAGNTSAIIFDSILHKTPPSATRVNPELPAELDRIINRCLEKERDLRYQTASDVCADLKRLKRDSSSVHTQVVTAEVQRTKPLRPRYRLYAIVAAIVLLAASGAGWLWFRSAGQSVDSIAVLPFVNSSSDPNSEYLSDGITEGVISSLSQNPKLRVMARSTVFRFKGKDVDPRQIGSELNVKAVLVGRLVQQDQQVRIQADLVNVADGTELWGEQYNRNKSDLMAVHQEIARDVANRLRVTLTGDQQSQIARGGTRNDEAYQLYLKGRFQWNLRTPTSLQESISLFRQAVEKDPSYALAWVGLADTYSVLPGYMNVPAQESYTKAKDAATHALQLDDSLPEAHAAMGSVYANLHQWQASEREFKRAIELNPGYANAHYFYSLVCLIPMGRIDEAVDEVKTALRLDPMSPILNANAGRVFFYARNFEEAAEQFRRALQIDPKFPPTHVKQLDFFEYQGMYGQAIDDLASAPNWRGPKIQLSAERVEALRKAFNSEGERGYWKTKCQFFKDDVRDHHVSPALVGQACAKAGNVDEGFAYLKQGVLEFDEEANWMASSPSYDIFRSDPRWTELMRLLGVEPLKVRTPR